MSLQYRCMLSKFHPQFLSPVQLKPSVYYHDLDEDMLHNNMQNIL